MGHQILSTNLGLLAKLEDAFGKEIFKGSRRNDPELERSNFDTGKRIINRSSLGKIVFSDRGKIARLNQIMWPTIAELQNMGEYIGESLT